MVVMKRMIAHFFLYTYCEFETEEYSSFDRRYNIVPIIAMITRKTQAPKPILIDDVLKKMINSHIQHSPQAQQWYRFR
jgi:hypothetical protein